MPYQPIPSGPPPTWTLTELPTPYWQPRMGAGGDADFSDPDVDFSDPAVDFSGVSGTYRPYRNT